MTVTLGGACSNVRSLESADRRCTSWVEVIETLVAQQCESCHSAEKSEGQYQVSTYLGVLGAGSDDVPNAIAGDATSQLLAVLGPDASLDAHKLAVDELALLTEWVVD